MPRLTEILLLCFFSAALVGAENVTTVFQLLETSAGLSPSLGTWSVVVRGSSRGLPLNRGKQGVSNAWAGRPCCESWMHEGWSKLDDGAATEALAPLSLEKFSLRNIDNSGSSSGTSSLKLDPNGVWRGQFPASSRVRLHFVPPDSGRAALGIFLCEPEGSSDTECVAILITGSTIDGKLLRFQTTKYGPRQSGSRRPTPNGYLKTSVSYRDDRVREGWLGNITYEFRIERTAQGALEVRLDEGDFGQKRAMSIASEYTQSRLCIALLPSASDPSRRFDVSDDSAWFGDLPLGEQIQVDFTPAADGSGHLGIALCDDRVQEHCRAGILEGSLDNNEPWFSGALTIGDLTHAPFTPYWIAGYKEARIPMPDSSRKAKWKPAEKRQITIDRHQDGAVHITVSGESSKYTMAVPPAYQFLVVDRYRNEGAMNVVSETQQTLSSSVWQLQGSRGTLRSPTMPEWFSQGDICVTIVARVGDDSALIVSAQRVEDGERKVLQQVRGSSGMPWISKRLTARRSLVLQNKKLQLVVEAQQPASTSTPVLVQWVAGCDPDAQEDRIIFHDQVSSTGVTESKGFQPAVSAIGFPPTSNPVCGNDGLFVREEGKCLCRPGFTGRLCEQGCGRNRFGENCESKCSPDSVSRQCRGMWLCTADFPCDCAPGLSGPRCDQRCRDGSYGVGCRQVCGSCAFDQPCDPYTGWCTTGCKGGLQPPFCKESCGSTTKVTSLIVNGNEVKAEKYPWHVAIYDKQYKTAGGNETKVENICGGSIISPTIVISAAHCFYNEKKKSAPIKQPSSKYQLAFGKTRRNIDAQEEHSERVQRRNVLQIHTPEDYRGIERFYASDLAILELDAPLNFNEYIAPVCFDTTGQFSDFLEIGSVGRVAGWGTTENNAPSEVLKEATLPFVPRGECIRNTPANFFNYASTGDKFCAGEQGVYVDQGDSGGGLVFSDTRSGAAFLRGIVSVRPPEVRHYAAYTNVTYHQDFIVKLMQVSRIRQQILKSLV